MDIGLKGKRIAVIGENRWEWEVAYLSIVCGTGIVVPLDKSLPENELKNSISTINKFINSPYTEEVSDFYEKVSRVGGFPGSAFFILPEKSVFDIYFSNTNYTFPVNILYPTVTVYFNYYIKGDDLGNNIISAFESSKFYSKLKNESYRSTKDSNINLNSNRDFIYGRRNVYNVIKIPDNKITKYLEAQ